MLKSSVSEGTWPGYLHTIFPGKLQGSLPYAVTIVTVFSTLPTLWKPRYTSNQETQVQVLVLWLSKCAFYFGHNSQPFSLGFLICELCKWPSEGGWEAGKGWPASWGKYIRISKAVVFHSLHTWKSPEFGLGWAKLWKLLKGPLWF